MVKETIKDLDLYQKIKKGKLSKDECIKLALNNLMLSAELEIKLKQLRNKIAELITENRSMSQLASAFRDKSNYFILMSDNKNKADAYKNLTDEKIKL